MRLLSLTLRVGPHWSSVPRATARALPQNASSRTHSSTPPEPAHMLTGRHTLEGQCRRLMCAPRPRSHMSFILTNSCSGAGPAAAAVSSFFASPAAQGARARCIQAAAMVQDKRLADCLRHGVGYHSAGEASADRASMERLFGEGSLPVLCTTSTLAMGVNLPAHLVIIKSTQAWRGSGQGYTEYPASQLLQMMVRVSMAGLMTHARDSNARGVGFPPCRAVRGVHSSTLQAQLL